VEARSPEIGGGFDRAPAVHCSCQAAEQRVRAIMTEHGVYDAFELRAELINYKKALYNLYQEAMAVNLPTNGERASERERERARARERERERERESE
jgi:hypothetical protein